MFLIKSKNTKPYSLNTGVDSEKVIELDLTKLEDELNETVTGATWTSLNGLSSFENESLSNSIASARVTNAKSGKALIKVILSTSNQQQPVFIQISVIDPNYSFIGDYQ